MNRTVSDPFDGLSNGDEVEVTIRGKVGKVRSVVNADSWHTYVGGQYVTPGIIQSVRLVESYEDGGVYKDASGFFWEYTEACNGWYVFGSSVVENFNVPKRPLTKVS